MPRQKRADAANIIYHVLNRGNARQTIFRKGEDVVCRYVERNPLRANLVEQAEQWKHGSLYRWNQSMEPKPQILSPWPIPRLPGWNSRVNEPLTDKELKALRTCVDRGRPFGDTTWVQETAQQYGMLSTLRSIGRPKKQPKQQ
ncbi:MAG: hypothetical protein R3C28_22370 [Pirellulaceae bacterium]